MVNYSFFLAVKYLTNVLKDNIVYVVIINRKIIITRQICFSLEIAIRTFKLNFKCCLNKQMYNFNELVHGSWHRIIILLLLS